MNSSWKATAVLESLLASATGALAILTLVWRDWIETVFKVDPDNHSGLTEVAVVLGLALVTLALVWQARRHWLRAAHTDFGG